MSILDGPGPGLASEVLGTPQKRFRAKGTGACMGEVWADRKPKTNAGNTIMFRG